jgi:N-sulfoglucosamine sulfohydrolase
MQELRRLQLEGKLPAAAGLFMGDHKPVEELYDVESDLFELQNLAASPAHQRTLRRLRAVHEKWVVETGDLGLIPEPEIAKREQELGTRYAILQQPGSADYLRRLRALVDAVNRNAGSGLIEMALDDPDPALRYWAIQGLANKERIVKAMSDSAPVVRIAAARAAHRQPGDNKAIAVMIRELKSDQEWVRLHAVTALDELGGAAKPAMEALREALKDSNEYVRRVATHALERS